MKNFYIYNNIFRTVIDTNIITLYITSTRYNNISIYKRWLSNLNQSEEIFRLENLNLNFFEIQKLWNQGIQKVIKTIATILVTRYK